MQVADGSYREEIPYDLTDVVETILAQASALRDNVADEQPKVESCPMRQEGADSAAHHQARSSSDPLPAPAADPMKPELEAASTAIPSGLPVIGTGVVPRPVPSATAHEPLLPAVAAPKQDAEGTKRWFAVEQQYHQPATAHENPCRSNKRPKLNESERGGGESSTPSFPPLHLCSPN
jgi:hypothetical protein